MERAPLGGEELGAHRADGFVVLTWILDDGQRAAVLDDRHAWMVLGEAPAGGAETDPAPG